MLRRAALQGLVALAPALGAAPAAAVLVASGDGTQNLTAPPEDPGFASAGARGATTAVYLGGGWVLTANHVATGSVELEGVVHQAVAGSAVRLEHTPGVGTDLKMFRLVSDPGLPDLAVAGAVLPLGADVVMIGRGRNRGVPVTWRGIDGFAWGTGNAMRWGTNAVAQAGFDIVVSSSTVRALRLDFDDDGGATDESIATVGDSGGPVFAEGPGGWELAGILIAISTFSGQPAETSLFGNATYAADLSYYRGQIVALAAQRACANGADDDGDGLADLADPGCASSSDAFETHALYDCDDGFDGDGDGATDWPDDPGCYSPTWIEDPACDDGLDNDGDGGIDWDGAGAATPDPQCTAPWRKVETASACGLGFEVALAAALLARLARRRRPA